MLFSNVFALYEVFDWPDAERHVAWTEWTLDTIAQVREGEGISPCPAEACEVLRRCFWEGQCGRYSWLFKLFPELRRLDDLARVVSRIYRNPVAFRVEEDKAGRCYVSQRLVYARGRPEKREGTAAIRKPQDPTERFANFVGSDVRPILLWISPEDSKVRIKDPNVRCITASTMIERCLPDGIASVRLARLGATGYMTEEKRSSLPTAYSKGRSGFYEQEEWDEYVKTVAPVPNRPDTVAAAIKPADVDVNDLDEQDRKELDELDALMSAHSIETSSSSGTRLTTTSSSSEARPSTLIPSTPPRPSPRSPQVPPTDSTIPLLFSPLPPAVPAHLKNLKPGTASYAIALARGPRPAARASISRLDLGPSAAAQQGRSPSKIPRTQPPPKTFGQVEGAAGSRPATSIPRLPQPHNTAGMKSRGKASKGQSARLVADQQAREMQQGHPPQQGQ